ncbi:MAG TPA: hypothetical protein VFU47_05890 [Armatimonadota bacterium]|nr:hypothetical protein [Armatimonadota bacterium]
MRLPILPAAGLALLLASAAGADQLIQIPTADLAPTPKLEYMHRVDGQDEGYATALSRFGKAYELMARYYNNEDGRNRIEGGGMFQLLPDGVVTPGVALGMWDITNSSPWGRRAFLVFTKSLEPGQLFVRGPLQRVQLTVGAGTGRFGGLLGGLRVDLPAHFSLVTEYDSRRLNAGLWFSPAEQITLKAELQNGNPYLGGAVKLRF